MRQKQTYVKSWSHKKHFIKDTFKDTSIISVFVSLLLCAPFILVKARKSATRKKHVKRMLIACIVLYPVNIVLSIPIEAAWLITYPLRLVTKYHWIRKFNRKLRGR